MAVSLVLIQKEYISKSLIINDLTIRKICKFYMDFKVGYGLQFFEFAFSLFLKLAFIRMGNVHYEQKKSQS